MFSILKGLYEEHQFEFWFVALFSGAGTSLVIYLLKKTGKMSDFIVRHIFKRYEKRLKTISDSIDDTDKEIKKTQQQIDDRLASVELSNIEITE